MVKIERDPSHGSNKFLAKGPALVGLFFFLFLARGLLAADANPEDTKQRNKIR